MCLVSIQKYLYNHFQKRGSAEFLQQISCHLTYILYSVSIIIDHVRVPTVQSFLSKEDVDVDSPIVF